MRPFPRLLILTALTFLGIFLMFFVAAILSPLLFGYNLLTDLQSIQMMDSPEKINVLKFLQLTSTIGFFILPPLILFKVERHESLSEHFYLREPSRAWMWWVIPILAWFLVPVVNVFGELNQRMNLPEVLQGVEQWMRDLEVSAEATTKAFTQVDTIPGLLYNLVLIAVLPAVGEELFFRGTLQPTFKKWTGNHHAAIWITAIIFSTLHFQFFGFLPRLFLGVVLGYLFVWSGSLWIPILAHFVNNASVVVIFYLIEKGMISAEIEDLGTAPGELIRYFVTGGIVSGALLYLVYRHRCIHPAEPELDSDYTQE